MHEVGSRSRGILVETGLGQENQAVLGKASNVHLVSPNSKHQRDRWVGERSRLGHPIDGCSRPLRAVVKAKTLHSRIPCHKLRYYQKRRIEEYTHERQGEPVSDGT
jgi:hypothetical protein